MNAQSKSNSSRLITTPMIITTAMVFSLIVAIQPCSAQTVSSPLAPPLKTAVTVDDTSSLAAGSSTDSTVTSSPPQRSGTSIADRVKSFDRLGPIRDGFTTIDLGTKYVRGVFGGLESSAGIGFGVQFTTADKIPGVELRTTLLTSSRLYRRFQGEAYVPHLFSENTHANFWFDYLRRTEDNFFGIGPRIPNTSMTNYDIERRSYNASVQHDFTSDIALGGYVSVANSSTYRGQKDEDIPIDLLFSGDPNVVPITAWAPGLMQNTKILRYGAFAVADLRDNSFGLTRGAYLYGRVGSADGRENNGRFSDYGWLEVEMDARGYIPLGSEKTSLALRGFSILKDPRGGSQIPFYDLSYYGGRSFGRGFKHFRFRGDNVLLASVELRQTVLTQREDRGLDVFAFGDAGQVWGDNRSQTDPAVLANQDFSSSNYRASVGGGIQYRYSKSFAGRIEIGHSHERNLIYFSVSRGF